MGRAHGEGPSPRDDLHRVSAILIEREKIDKDQFERLLARESEEDVFAEEEAPTAPESKPEADRKRLPKPTAPPVPLAGAGAPAARAEGP